MTRLFTQNARKEFANYVAGFIETAARVFSDEELKTRADKFALSVRDEESLTCAVDAWVAYLKTPLNEKKVKYAKAIERITNKPAVCMHALMYHDIDGLKVHVQGETSDLAEVILRWPESNIDEDDKKELWKFAEKIANAGYDATEQQVPTVPTRREIQDNIKNRKKEAADDGTPSMQRAFFVHINTLAGIWGQDSVLQDDEQDVKQWMKRWASFTQEEKNGVKNSARCAEEDVDVLNELRIAFPEFKVPVKNAASPDVWIHVRQLNSFSAVVDNIPVGMMSHIESMASKLADDIVSGKANMNNLNLSELGQHVLSQCKEEDMDKFADNIDTLLPALQQFQGLPSIGSS